MTIDVEKIILYYELRSLKDVMALTSDLEDECLEWQRDQERAIRQQVLLEENPIISNGVHAVLFYSHSGGKKKKRKARLVFLISVSKGCWRAVSDRDGTIPWDVWAIDIFGRDFCSSLSDPEEYLRRQVKALLNILGRF